MKRRGKLKIGKESQRRCASIARELGPRYFGSSGAYSRRPSKGVKSWLMVCRVVTFSEGPLGGKCLIPPAQVHGV